MATVRQIGISLFGLLLAMLAQADALPGRRVALVIGNGNYAKEGALRNPVNDARDMCAKLKSLQFETLCYLDIKTRREFKTRIQEYVGKLTNGTAGLFYYAGHGIQVNGENYLIPTHIELKSQVDVEDEAVSVNYLMAQLDSAKNPFNIVILDACRNNPWARGFRSISRGLAATNAPEGSIVLYATAANEEAFDGSDKNGTFTKHLLTHLGTRGITVEQLIKRVSAGVQKETLAEVGHKQTPFVYSSFTGEFCFAGCEQPEAPDSASVKAKSKKALAAEEEAARKQKQEMEALRSGNEALERRMKELNRQQAEIEAARKQQQSERNRNTPNSKHEFVPPAF